MDSKTSCIYTFMLQAQSHTGSENVSCCSIPAGILTPYQWLCDQTLSPGS
jgi:hypothetical protein